MEQLGEEAEKSEHGKVITCDKGQGKPKDAQPWQVCTSTADPATSSCGGVARGVDELLSPSVSAVTL